jgi:uncharacterized protein
VRRGYDAFNRGDIAAVLELFDPSVELGVLDDSPIGEVSHGHDGFRKLLAENNEMFDQYRNLPEEIVAVSEEKVVVVVRSEARGRLSGAEVGGRVAHLWTLRDGKVVRLQLFRSREAAIDAATGG